MKYIKKLILLILFSLAYNVQAQHILSGNLVPNPATNQINVAFEKELRMDAVFELYDFSGKQILSTTIKANTTFSTINLNTVKAGIYYYKLTTINETLIKNKLVILNK